MSDIFAVRWARRELKRLADMDYTKWHASYGDGSFTLCGLCVPIGLAGTFLPETEDELQKVSCRKCTRLLTPRQPDAERRAGYANH